MGERAITLLYFAGARDVAGVGEERVRVPPHVRTVAELGAWIAERHPALAPRMTSVRIARNERFAAPEERVEEGDVIALIPPVAGG
jgi:molybdopterin synthase sulfur carrier subunit